MTVYAITDTKKGEQGLRLYLSSNYPFFFYRPSIKYDIKMIKFVP